MEKLTKEQMKLIVGGVEDGGAVPCSTQKCTYIELGGTTFEGDCTVNTNPMQTGCGCKKENGTIIPDQACVVKSN